MAEVPLSKPDEDLLHQYHEQFEALRETSPGFPNLEMLEKFYHEAVKLGLHELSDELLGLYGAIMAHFIQHQRIEAAEHEQRVLAEALRDASAALNSTLDFDEVLDGILTSVGRVVPHDSANIMLVEHGIARIARSKDYSRQQLQEDLLSLRFNVDETPTLQTMLTTHQPLIIPDVRHYEHWTRPVDLDWIRSYVGIPIFIEGSVIGFLNLNSITPNFFSSRLVEPLQVFSNQIAIAVQNARAFQQAQELAVVNERQRLARELHDEVNQTLFAIKVTAETLPRLWKEMPPALKHHLAHLSQLGYRGYAEMQLLLLELRPAALTKPPFDQILRQLVDTFNSHEQIYISLDVMGSFRFPGDVQVVLYRIVQEALKNITQHAQAAQVEIRLRQLDQGIELTIRDNGQGFEINTIPPAHLGIKIMQEQVQTTQTAIDVTSQQREGTQMIVKWSGTLL